MRLLQHDPEIGRLEAIPDADMHAPATEYRFADGIGRVGFIASVTRPFCLNCNRIRLTADGHVRYCLFAIEETDVRSLLRGGASDEALLPQQSARASQASGSATKPIRNISYPRPDRCIRLVVKLRQVGIAAREDELLSSVLVCVALSEMRPLLR